jgi:hypothetical protein
MNIFRRTIVVWGFAIGISTVAVTGASADYFFSDSDLAEFYMMSGANACREQCASKLPGVDAAMAGYTMVRLEVLPPGDSRQVYLVKRTGECGSAGCESAVLLRQAGRMVRIEERFGLDTDRAERIARGALGLMNPRESGSSNSPVAVTLAVLCVAALCVLAAIVTKRLATGLSVGQRIVLQTMTALISSVGLYAFGVVDEINLLALPVIAGLTVTVAISLRDIFS